MVGQYAPLVRRLALQLAARLPASVDLDDLVQSGMIGLLDALRRYRKMPQAQFETYAVSRIRGAMLDELRSQDWLPRSVRSKVREIEQAVALLNQKLSRAPTEQEVAQALGLTLSAYQAMLEDVCGVQVVHYEDLVRHHNEPSGAPEPAHADVQDVSVWAGDPLHQLMTHRQRAALIAAIDRLPEREQQLLSLLFQHDLNQKEIAGVLGVTEGRVSQLRSQAIVRIRADLARYSWHENPGEQALRNLL